VPWEGLGWAGGGGSGGGGGGGPPPSLAAAALFAPVLSGTTEGPLILIVHAAVHSLWGLPVTAGPPRPPSLGTGRYGDLAVQQQNHAPTDTAVRVSPWRALSPFQVQICLLLL
jgi:hypothetical protein